MKNNRSLRNLPLWKMDGDKNRIRVRPLAKFQGKTIFQLQKLSSRARKDLDFELVEKIDAEVKDRIGEKNKIEK
jgi:hypothetical protein